MSKLALVHYPNEVLRTRAEEITNLDGSLAEFMDNMAETMYASNGVGLAAPQVGVSKRIITVDVGADGEQAGPSLYLLANPVIVETHGELIYSEGCLSFPGLTVDVHRYAEVLVRAIDRAGNPIEIEASGLKAVCLQHEIDHLDGITFVDRVNALRRRIALREYGRARSAAAGKRAA
jgi:peptide deformylase